MEFHATAKITEGVADVDPVAAPETILNAHFMQPPISAPKDPTALYLALLGGAGETVTVDLYFLIENGKAGQNVADYKNTSAVWFKFVTAEVITVGTLTKITAGLPAGGIVYAAVTADTIGAGLTRDLVMAWR
jgi:hypothetical protein